MTPPARALSLVATLTAIAMASACSDASSTSNDDPTPPTPTGDAGDAAATDSGTPTQTDASDAQVQDGSAADAAALSLWSKRFGGVDGMERASGVATDTAGNIVIAGEIESDTDFGGGTLVGAGGFDVLVAKFDPTGKPLWSKRFGDSARYQEATSVAIDAAGNVFIAGGFDGTADFGGGLLKSAGDQDIFVAKFSPDGTHVWSKRFGDVADYQTARTIAVDAMGNVLVAGEFEGTVDFGGGPHAMVGSRDAFVAKLDTNGGHLWSRTFGSTSATTIASITSTSSNEVVMVGDFGGTVDFTGADADAGSAALTSEGGKDVFALELDSSGAHVWSKRFGGTASRQTGVAVAVGPSGKILVGCTFEGTIDFGGGALVSPGDSVPGTSNVGVAMLTPAGAHVWSKTFGDDARQTLGGFTFDDAKGNVVLTGAFKGSIDFGGGPLTATSSSTGMFLAELDESGTHLWSKGFGTDGDFNVNRVTTDPQGTLIYAGGYTGKVDFGYGPLVTPAPDAGPQNYDLLLAKLAPGKP